MSDLYPAPEGFFVTTLSSDLTATATVINLTAVPTDITKGYLLIEASSATNREVVHFTSVGATTVTSADDTTDASDASGRGCAGSITQGGVTAHDQGVAVIVAAVRQYWARQYSSFTQNHNVAGTHKTLTDSNGNEWLEIGVTASAVNHLKLSNAATGNNPVLEAAGGDTNISLVFKPKGTGVVVTQDSNGNEIIGTAYVASAVNEITIKNAATGNAPEVQATGGDTNIDVGLTPKGTGDIDIKSATANIKLNGSDPWRTIDIFGLLSPTTTSGCAALATVEATTNDIDYKVLDFATDADENAFCNFRMPDSYDGGPIQFRYEWTNAAGLTTETVTFELSGRAYADNDAIDQAVGTAVEVADTWIAQGDVHTSAWSGDVTLAGTPAGGEWVHLEIMRDISEDDLTGDARLMNVQIRYKQTKFSD